MATAKTKPTKGFRVFCPVCGEKDSLVIKIYDVHDLLCNECGMEMTAEEFRERIAGWMAMLEWLESAPLLAE
jgi:uncharacterized protein (DUF983 family)